MVDPLCRKTSGGAVDALLEAHRKARDCLALARRIAEGAIASPEDVGKAASRVERFLSLRWTAHVRDEEESLAPRLCGREREVDSALEAMVREHRDQQRPFAVLVTAFRELARVPSHLPRLAPFVRKALERLERLFAGHLAREETVIFPAIRRILDASAEAQILWEMRVRRCYAG
jgi:iron-sulfur cluster repair protein YtfE (RIC family)